MKYLFFILFFISTLFLHAEPALIVKHYTSEQGLPNNIVTCSLKGEDGFIWFGTWYGLCSFDGMRFKSYNSREENCGADSDTPPRKIEKMVEDRNGFLWIKTVDRKLYIFNKRTACFNAIYNEIKGLTANTQIIKIQETTDGRVLLLTKEKDLLCGHVEPDGMLKIELLHNSSQEINLYSSRLKHNVLVETAGAVGWIGKDFKIFSENKGEELMTKPADYISRQIDATVLTELSCANLKFGYLWLGSITGKIYCANTVDGNVKLYDLSELDAPILDIQVNSSGMLYIIVEGKGIYEYDMGRRILRKLSSRIKPASTLYTYIDSYDKLWIVDNNNALVYLDPLSSVEKSFPFSTGNAISTFEWRDDPEQELFFLTPSGELWAFERESLEMVSLNTLKPFADIATGQLFFDMMMDDEGVLWLASTAMGVYRVNFPKKQFKLRTFRAAAKDQGRNEGIRALFQAKNGDIWVGNRWAELYRLDAAGKQKTFFSAGDSFVGSAYHIMEDREGNLWISTKGNGLLCATPDMFSPNNFRFARYTNKPNQLNTLNHNDVYYTYQDSKGRIWVGLMGGGLNLVWTENGQVTFKHKYNGFNQYPPYGLYMEVRSIVEDESGRIWVATTDGLMSFDGDFDNPDEIVFETYRDREEKYNFSDNDIYALYKDSNGQVWVSIFGGGLNRLINYDYAGHKPVFESHGIKQGLNAEVIVSIVEDSNGYLWLATEGGLSRFDRISKRFRNFDKYDGLLNVRLEEASALYTQDKEIWLGCKEGVLMFNPEMLESFNADFRTFIVDFTISNKELSNYREDHILSTSIKYAESITLKHNQSMFTLEFAALNFFNPNRISYKYILEGYEKEWHHNGKNRIASYTNVPSGKYKFRVQSIDEAASGYVSEAHLQVIILPPWWLSWWAITIYALIGLAILFFILRFSLLYIKMKNDVYVEHKLSELKIKFFTNISHELRTPLSLIKGPIQELKDGETLSRKGKQYVNLMEKNTDQMLQLVNQILDFRKLQNGKMKLHVSLVNLNTMLNSFQKEFRILAEEKAISYEFHLLDEPVMAWVDKERLGMVIRNVISNAFKFTPEGGTIFVNLSLSEDGKHCSIRVEDSGIGIDSDKLDEIFERFAQGENAKNAYYQGTGIGLALSKEIMHLHHGEIVAESLKDKGAAFMIMLQLDKSHFQPGEVDFYISDDEKLPESADGLPSTDEHDEEQLDESLPSLLIVEDNRDLIALLRMQLEEKFNVYTANNGMEGLKKINLYHPDIVITDQMMPEMDGIEMLRKIRADFQISHIPVIILTAKNDDEAKTKAIHEGANAYITKPFNKGYLEARIEQLLRERRLFRERVWQHQEQQTEPDSYGNYLVKKDVQLLEKIHKVIEENMDNSDFNIDTIAQTLGLSRSAFFKKLKSLIGLAPVDLVKEIRLSKSLELLKTTDMSITEVAYAVGFKDSGYYTKCFRKKYNQTPREFITEWRKA